MLSKILCFHEHYDNSGNYAVCNLYIHKTVEAAGLSKDVRLFPWDSLREIGVHGMIRNLLSEVKNYRPGVLIFLVPEEMVAPLGPAFQYIRQQYGTRIIAYYGDMITGLVSAGRHRVYEFFSRMSDAVISVDSTCTRVIYDHQCNIQGHPTIDLRTFYPVPDVVKDIDVSFLGSLSHWFYESRREYLEYIKPKLAEKGYRLYTGGGQYRHLGEENLVQADYVHIMNRSKIVLNFSRTFSDYRQMKGRVMEAMACGSFVLSEDCPYLQKFFVPGKEYVPFDSKTELLDKIFYYLGQEGEREQIAAAGYKKMTQMYNPRNVWGYVFKKLGFDIPEINDENFLQYEKKMNEIQDILDVTYPSLHSTGYIQNVMEKKRYNLAVYLSVQRLKLFPLSVEDWFSLGKSLHCLGQHGEAECAFERCNFLDPLAKQKYGVLPGEAEVGSEKPVSFDMKGLLEPPARAFVKAVIITKDNGAVIERCLNSLLEAVDGIVLVDLGSRDRTVEIIKQYRQLYHHVFLLEQEFDLYAEALMVAIEQPVDYDNEWIFYIHPDEYLFPEDKDNFRLAAGLFSGQDTFLNILLEPLSPQAGSDAAGNFTVEENRLFPKKLGYVLTYYGISYDSRKEIKNQTLKIRLYYDLSHS